MNPLPLSSPSPPAINLALQGGGSHGAFTWGVLDALLDDGRISFEGISGTSAGAMNAVALAHGFAQAEDDGRDPREAARASLASFWEGIVSLGALTEAHREPYDLLFGGPGSDYSIVAIFANAVSSFWSNILSPYQSNPFDINPLRSFLKRQIDFEALARPRDLKVFVVATRVTTGKAEVFTGSRLSADAVMASACLPTLFKAVEIEGDHFWDGGYSGNPAIHPLIYNCTGRDIVLVQINPIKRARLPTTTTQISDRVNEVTFNASLIGEMRAIEFVNRLLADGKLDPSHYKPVFLHRIDGGAVLEAFAASTKSSTHIKLIQTLRDLGRAQARTWLGQHFSDLGVNCSVDIKQDYLDDVRASAIRQR